MKKLQYILWSLLGCAALLCSCGTDNFDEPTATLSGQVVYQGQPINVKSGGVELQLYQDGYAKKDPIGVQVAQDGSFKATLFKGVYKLITKDGNGPWESLKDTTVITVDGNTNYNVEVTPYYILSDATMSISGSKLKAKVTLKKVIASATLSSAIIVIGKTNIVDDSWNVAKLELPAEQLPYLTDGTYPFEYDIDLSSLSARHLFGRIGVKASGADSYIFTPVIDLGTPQ